MLYHARGKEFTVEKNHIKTKTNEQMYKMYLSWKRQEKRTTQQRFDITLFVKSSLQKKVTQKLKGMKECNKNVFVIIKGGRKIVISLTVTFNR